MAENAPATPPVPPASAEFSNQPTTPQLSFNIGEEFGTAKKNLPSMKIVGLCVGIIAVIIAVATVLTWPHPSASGSIGDVVSADVPGQNIQLVALNLALQNHGKQSYWIREITVELDTGASQYKDTAANAVDFDRYFQAFPALKAHALPPLVRETKIPIGASQEGTVIVSFAVKADEFAARKGLKVTIEARDESRPLILTK